MNEEKIITLPYADDFRLITIDPRKHQKNQIEIKSKIESIGMRLKPAKCRSFSIRSSVPSRINFAIGETEIPNIFQEEQKFLGKLLFPKSISPRATSQVTISQVATSQTCKIPSGNFSNDNFPSGNFP